MSLKVLLKRLKLAPLFLIGAAFQCAIVAATGILYGTYLSLTAIFEPIFKGLYRLRGHKLPIWSKTQAVFNTAKNIILDLCISILEAVHTYDFRPKDKEGSAEVGLAASWVGAILASLIGIGLAIFSLPLTWIPFTVAGILIAAPIISKFLLINTVEISWPGRLKPRRQKREIPMTNTREERRTAYRNKRDLLTQQFYTPEEQHLRNSHDIPHDETEQQTFEALKVDNKR